MKRKKTKQAVDIVDRGIVSARPKWNGRLRWSAVEEQNEKTKQAVDIVGLWIVSADQNGLAGCTGRQLRNKKRKPSKQLT
jgi:hypothetical protein